MTSFILAVAVSTLAVSALANSGSPYVGQETREIKALSQHEIDGYLNGRGMGYAKTAELNSFPGTRHVLDLAEELALTEKQTVQTQAIYKFMKTEAVALGKQLVEQEGELDQRFADRSIDAASIKALSLEIGALQAELRFVHLKAHIEQRSLLTKNQTHRYDRLRDFGDSLRIFQSKRAAQRRNQQ